MPYELPTIITIENVHFYRPFRSMQGYKTIQEYYNNNMFVPRTLFVIKLLGRGVQGAREPRYFLPLADFRKYRLRAVTATLSLHKTQKSRKPSRRRGPLHTHRCRFDLLSAARQRLPIFLADSFVSRTTRTRCARPTSAAIVYTS